MEQEPLFHRHVHPALIQNDVVSYQAFLEPQNIQTTAFLPSARDQKKLSVYNGEIYSPEQSYIHYTQNLKSSGCLSVTKSECESVVPLSVVNDDNPFKGHSYVDFTKLPDKPADIKARAVRLKTLAVQRNWTFKK